MVQIGIYVITCNITNKCYVGSSINIKQRRKRHFSDLKCNRHCNRYLQNAWLKYGSTNFSFEILEECATTTLLENEKKWITHYDSLNLNKGFNLCLETNRPHENIRRKEKNFKLIDPNGNVIIAAGIKKFAKQNRLNDVKLSMLTLGKLRYYKGYRQFNAAIIGVPFNKEQFQYGKKLMKTYSLLSPEGNTVTFTGLAKHCNTYKLSAGTLCAVLNGTRKSHKGWKLI